MQIPDYVKGEIYKATCKPTGAVYAGQTRTHYRSGFNYYPWGCLKRWTAHLIEAFSLKPGESVSKLNAAIRQYGANAFTLELVETCSIYDLDTREIYFISQYNSHANGLNSTKGGSGVRSIPVYNDEMKEMTEKQLKERDERRIADLAGIDLVSVKISLITTTMGNFPALYFRKPDESLIKIDFSCNKLTLEQNLERAVLCASKIMPKDSIFVQRRLQDSLKKHNLQGDDRLEVNSRRQKVGVDERYEKLKHLDIEEILIQKVVCGQISSYRLDIACKGGGKKYVNFGGKLTNLEESEKNARELAVKLAPDKIRHQGEKKQKYAPRGKPFPKTTKN